MKKKILWVVVSCLMVLSLVIASCAPKQEAKEIEVGKATVVTAEEEKVAEEVVKEEGILPPEVPKYGGVYVSLGAESSGFDPRVVMVHFTRTLPITHELLLTGDWAKGPAGTGETDWQVGFCGRTDLFAGQLAESWELPEEGTIIYHIRKGVKWQNKPPVNGRELTAQDVAWNIEKEWRTPGTNLDIFFKKEDHLISVTALDKYTVELKFPPQATAIHIMENSCRIFMLPPEITQIYGNQNDWRLSTGTGPFILKDYVPGSSITYERNPNYWQYDPLHPENKLPYLDGIKQLIIPDLSTQLASLRTGKIDMLSAVSWENAELLMKQCPELEYVTAYGQTEIPCGRVDKPELPFDDLRVRQALNLAVNQQEIVDEYYQGHALLMGWPFYPIKAHKPFYTPLEEMPESVQELFTYNPEKARQLLADAGYPNGFNTEIACSTASVDFLSMIREYLLKVGVDMQIKPLEPGMFFSVNRGRTHKEMIFKETKMFWGPWLMHEVRVDSADCASFYQDERTLAVYDEINRNLGRDDAKWIKSLKDLVPFMIAECWGIWMPVPETYIMWWPWFQNFYGCVHIGYSEMSKYTLYSWVDPALKKSMGY